MRWRLDSGTALEILGLVAVVLVWVWWLGPEQQRPWEWGPGGLLHLDALGLLFLTLFLAVPPPVQSGSSILQTATGPAPIQPGSPALQTGTMAPARPRPRLPQIGWGVCRTGLILVVLAGPTIGQ